MDGVEQHEAEERADTGHGVEQLQGLSLVVLGGGQDGEGPSLAPLVLIGQERQGDGQSLWSRGSGTALGNTVTMGLRGDRLAHLGERVLTVRLLAMRQQRSACTPQVGAAPPAGTGGAPLGRLDRGLWQPAAAPEHRHLWGSALVMCGLAPVESLPREGVTKDEGHTLRRAKVSEPVPGEDPGNGHHQTVPRGRNGFQKGCRSGWHLAGEQDVPVGGHDTDLHTAGRQSSPTVKGGLGSVEAPEVFSSFMRDFFPSSAYHWGMWRGRPQSLSKASSRLPPASAALPPFPAADPWR